MTYGQLFKQMFPKVEVRRNGSCVWIFYDNCGNHYPLGVKYWDKEIPYSLLEHAIHEQKPEKGGWHG